MRSALALLILTASAGARVLDPDTRVTQQNWAFAQSDITGMAWAPDGSGRLFVTIKGASDLDGAVRIVQMLPGGGGMLVPAPFATINPVYTNSECGVIGIVFDPDFARNGYVYLFVTVSSFEQQIIRYTAVGDLGTDKTTLVGNLPTRGQNHDGGAIGIGPDNKLYWAIGDNGGSVPSGCTNDTASLACKMGRANLDGTVPRDNPLFDGPGPNNDYIWARGFRNPFTMTFQPGTWELWLDVVGTTWEQAFVVRRGDHAGWNAYENSQPVGYLTPQLVYYTGSTRIYGVFGAVRAGGVTTFNVDQTHYMRRGERISITGVADGSFNGTFYVDSAPRLGTMFSVLQPGQPDAQVGAGGNLNTFTFGRALTGATFYDGTLFPPAYRGNYFFTDFVDGNLGRARVGPGVQVNQVDPWADLLGAPVDAAVGPDGALYVAQIGGQIVRFAYTPPGQGLVVAEQHLRGNEGGSVFASVRLLVAPAGNVVVSVARSAGDADVTVAAGASLTFTTADWMNPQAVRLAAAEDGDADNDVATFTVSSPGMGSQTVDVLMTDNDSGALGVSPPALALAEGASGTLQVVLTAAPAADVVVTVARTAGDADVVVSAGGRLTFTAANWMTAQVVTVAAGQDADNTDDMAVISASAPGYALRTATVMVRDDEQRAPAITSVAPGGAVVGVEYQYDVEANGSPVPSYALVAPMPAGMTIDAASGLVRWTPAAVGAVAARVRAQNGVSPDAEQGFMVVVAADQPPTASLTRPRAGDVVAGATTEFYGDGVDDVGAVRAEFYVDGVLGSTDSGSMGHFHFGGAHLMWDTTRYADGPHRLRFVVYDVKGQSGMQEIDVTIANGGDGGDGGALDASIDAAPGVDGGVAGGDAAGCGCRSGARGGASGAAALWLIGLVVGLRRRRVHEQD